MEVQDSDAAEDMNNHKTMSDDVLNLPPGFRFHPTDEEVITHYLIPKVLDREFTAAAIAEVDLNKCEPWDMPGRAKIGEKDWYFFCQKDRKYPTGTRTNRATKSGYWKATGKDKEICRVGRRTLVGMKKTLVFYLGRAPKGEKMNWVMHEFRIEGQFPYHHLPHINKDEWVVCRVFNKSAGGVINNNNGNNYLRSSHPPMDWTDFTTSFMEELLENPSASPPPLVDPSGIACRGYSTKWDDTDLVEGNHQDDGSCFLIPSDVLLPRPPVQNYNPFGNSDYSPQGLMGKLRPRPEMLERYKGDRHSSANPSLIALCRDEAEFEGSNATGIDVNNETSSTMTTINGSVTGRSNEVGYYGYIESSLMDPADDYDLALESLMNQENPIF
ncbi:hypothetical protein MLD38_030928 [Melastoma candidum]|uniref:Uncharacterized protein n=1 Tax=Melastoma candidum TaxID=119954 RepID=A0ACB9MMK9_9MYRT|nr:hypothetical protein MLD38_030928 [Melastoma candidum]